MLHELDIDDRDAQDIDPYNHKGRLGTTARFTARTTYAKQRIIAHYFGRWPNGMEVDTPGGTLKIWFNKADADVKMDRSGLVSDNSLLKQLQQQQKIYKAQELESRRYK